MVNDILHIEKKLREAEASIEAGTPIQTKEWINLMQDLGFLINNRFLPIADIIDKAKKLNENQRAFALESVGNNLSKLI